MMLAETVETVEGASEALVSPARASVLLNCASDERARRISRIVEFLGAATRLVEHEAEHRASEHPAQCLITDAETLSRMDGDSWAQLGNLANNILVYGFETEGHAELLRGLTLNSLLGVKRLSAGAHKLEVTAEAPELCRQLSGLTTELKLTCEVPVFDTRQGKSNTLTILEVDEKPTFVRVPARNGAVFLVAGSEIPDLDAPVLHGQTPLDFLPGLAPWLMFLRASLGTALWETAEPLACFIIDDPLLKARYGFLEYEALLKTAQREGFSASIAFIPLNYKRSEPGTAKLFANHPECLSVCVHGCDHTWGEFGGTHESVLRRQAEQALAWMERHQTLSGVGFDNVMVFPQGIFSRAAMEALGNSGGYLAAVNSTPFPVDPGAPLPVLRELLEPAIARFGNFPLFTRRYPQNLPALTFDLFLGRPALLVEHHGYFRDGYEALSRTVQELARIEPRLRWTNLGEVCSRTSLERANRKGEVEVQFYTNRFRFTNHARIDKKYVFLRRAAAQKPEACTVNGRPVNFATSGQFVRCSVALKAGETAELRLKFKTPGCEPALPRAWSYKARVFTRRRLSEFKDNCVEPAKHKLRKRR